MKKINKFILDECIDLTRKYWSPDATEPMTFALDDRIEFAKKSGVAWSTLVHLLDGILASCGLKPDATNFDIYLVLKLLGWEVVDEEIEDGKSLRYL